VSWEHRGRTAVVGIGTTEFSRASGRSVLSLATEASLGAIVDAGLTVDQIDGIIRCESDEVRPNDLAESIGAPAVTFWASLGTGGAAPCGMVGVAVGAILSGQASCVLLYRSLNGRSGRRFGRAVQADRVGGNGSYDEFFVPYGLAVPGQMFALIARHHMIEFGTRPEDLGHIALTCRERANANPGAQLNGRTLTMDDYLSARTISSPLRLFDFCLETDGACAIVITLADRARDLRQRPAFIQGVAQGMSDEPQLGLLFPSLLRTSLTTQPSAHVASVLYERAGMGPEDIDVAQFYDCFTITVLLQLEDYGFCKKGEGGPFSSSGELGLEGSIPINTSGGHLSEGYIHGMNHVVEGVRQVRGTSTAQVPGAETCLVTSGIPVATSAMVLSK
jgi:acetyl-CoA acetyltransferase